jgi:hypothetical protein
MSVSAYGHCRPGVEGYDSWVRDSGKKHTTHLSSAQEELKIKVVERLQTEPASPCCTSTPHPLCHGDGPRSVSLSRNGSAKAGHVTPRRTRRLFLRSPEKGPRHTSFDFFRRVWLVWQKQGADLLSNSSLRGGPGLCGSGRGKWALWGYVESEAGLVGAKAQHGSRLCSQCRQRLARCSSASSMRIESFSF